MSAENGSHEETADRGDNAAQGGADDRQVIFVEVRRAEPPLNLGPVCVGAALLVGIVLGRLAEKLSD